MLNKQIFMESMAKLQQVFGKKLEKEVYEIYWNILNKFNDKEFSSAISKLLYNFRPSTSCQFPVPAEFILYLGKDTKTQAVNIISTLRQAMEKYGQYQSMNFKDLALHSVVQRYGGWIDMVNNNTDEWWSLHERNFILAYDSARRAGINGPDRLHGILEKDNIEAGYTPDTLATMGIKPELAGYEKDPSLEVKRIENAPKRISPKKTTRELLKSDVGKLPDMKNLTKSIP